MKRSKGLATFMRAVLTAVLVAGIVTGLPAVTKAEQPSEENRMLEKMHVMNDLEKKCISDSGYLRNTDGTVYAYTYALMYADGVANAYFTMFADSMHPPQMERETIEALIYLPQVDRYVVSEKTMGGTGNTNGPGSAVITDQVEYEGKRMIGQIVSVTAKFYIADRQVGTLTLTWDENGVQEHEIAEVWHEAA